MHTLYAANLDGEGGLLPMQMAVTAEGMAGVREELSLVPVEGFGGLLDRQTTVLVTCPESLDLPGTRASNVRYVGPVLEDAGPDAGWRPPGVDDGRPLVVVSLGTTPMDEGPVLQRLLSALGDAPARVVATLGDHLDLDDLSVPANVHLRGHVRHAAMLPWASAFVSHGGLGSVLAALSHGLPQVCVPLGPGTAAQRGRRRAGRGGLQRRPDLVARRLPRRGRPACRRRHGAAGGGGVRLAMAIDAQRAAGDAELEIERLLHLQ